jgi:hypothetical protein
MWTLGPLGFAAPLLLLGLFILPILWILLRAVPPAPVTRRFPGVALLLGLQDDESQSDRTPWWLLLLRLLAVAALIIGFAGPVLNPSDNRTGTGNLLIALDGSWAGAPNWTARMDRVDALLSEAARNDRPVRVVNLSNLPVGDLTFSAANDWQNRIATLQPQAWQPRAAADWVSAQTADFETQWMSDGIDWDGRTAALAAFEAKGAVTVFQSPRATFGLQPAVYEDGAITLSAIRTPIGAATSHT